MNFPLFFHFILQCVLCLQDDNVAIPVPVVPSVTISCPAAESLPPHDGYLSYPIDVFVNNQTMGSIDNSRRTTVKCSTIIRHAKQLHTCPLIPLPQACPLIMDNVITASQMDWKYKTSLCHVHQQLSNVNATIRVFVLGGSFTLGRSSRGCCCSPQVDIRCLSNTCSETREPVDGSTTCRWSNFLQLFFNKYFKAPVEVINLSSTAQSSDKTLQANSKHLVNLTQNDIVFLDHSVNDGFYFHRPGYDKTLLTSVEHLIRFIITASHNHPPTIILLEMWPFPYGGYTSRERYDKLAHTKQDYSSVYRKLVQYYSIPLWSYKEMVRTVLYCTCLYNVRTNNKYSRFYCLLFPINILLLFNTSHCILLYVIPY